MKKIEELTLYVIKQEIKIVNNLLLLKFVKNKNLRKKVL